MDKWLPIMAAMQITLFVLFTLWVMMLTVGWWAGIVIGLW